MGPLAIMAIFNQWTVSHPLSTPHWKKYLENQGGYTLDPWEKIMAPIENKSPPEKNCVPTYDGHPVPPQSPPRAP